MVKGDEMKESEGHDKELHDLRSSIFIGLSNGISGSRKLSVIPYEESEGLQLCVEICNYGHEEMSEVA